MGCNMDFKVLSYLPKHGMQQLKAQSSFLLLSRNGSSSLSPCSCSMQTNLCVHDELYLSSPKIAMCFRSSVLLPCSPGFPVTIWKYHGISAVWNGSQQTLFRQLMIPQSLCVSVSSPSCKQFFSSASWMLILLILLWFTSFGGAKGVV